MLDRLKLKIDREWLVIWGLLCGLGVAGIATIFIWGWAAIFPFVIGVALGCLGQAVMLELQKRD